MSMKFSSPSLNYVFFYLCFFSEVMCQSGFIGVCNGRLGNNLPSEEAVVKFYKTNGITKMRIYNPNQLTLTALQDSGIDLILDVPNVDLPSLQSDATQWVQANVVAHFPATKIRYIAVGNEVNPGDPETRVYAPLVLPAMQNIYAALAKFGLQNQTKVSTATFSAVLTGFPPSASVFKYDFMIPIVQLLAKQSSPLLANIYPYFAFTSGNITLDYALFTSPKTVVYDKEVNISYQNLFDAMVDSMYYAVEKAGGTNVVKIVVSETGWPSDGDPAATIDNAGAYYRNLVSHVKKGTPKSNGTLETYLFAMFDENNKPGRNSEQHFGLFYPNFNQTPTPKYQLSFNSA